MSADLQQSLEAVAKELHDGVGGKLGVAVRHLPSGKHWGVNADDYFPLASVFKVPVLVELVSQVAEGRLALDQRIALEDPMRSPGSGLLRFLGSGLQPTVRDLATLMIIISDNTATDMVMDLVGARRAKGGRVNKRMEALGFEGISVVEDCRGLLLLAGGMAPDDRSPAQLKKLGEKLDEGKWDFEGPAFQADPTRNNIAKPASLANLFAAVQEGTILDETGRKTFLDICLLQLLNQRIPLLLPDKVKVAHKTGTIAWTRNDAGIIYLPDGSPLVFCAMTERVPEDKWQAGDQAIAKAARAAWDAFA